MEHPLKSFQTISTMMEFTQLDDTFSDYCRPTTIIDLPSDLIEDIFRYVIPDPITIGIHGGGHEISFLDVNGWTMRPAEVMDYSLIHPKLTPSWARVFYKSIELFFTETGTLRPFAQRMSHDIRAMIEDVHLGVGREEDFEAFDEIRWCCKYFQNLKRLELNTQPDRESEYYHIPRGSYFNYARESRRIKVAIESQSALSGGKVALCVTRRPAKWIE